MTIDKGKIIPLSIISGLSFWVVDAAIDAVLFRHGSFLDSLILDVSGHELYFRTFFIVSFVLFGIVISRIVARTEKDREHLREATLKAALEEAKSKAIFAAIGDGISIQDTDFRVLYQNSIHKGFVGDHKGEFCYRAYESREEVCSDCPIAMVFHDGEIHSSNRVMTNGDSVSHFEITASPLRDTEGNVIAGVEVVRDVTAKQETEEELLLHKERLSSIVEERTSELKSAVDLLQEEIMDRRDTEEALRQSEKRYRELVNFMSSGVAVFQTDNDGSNFILTDLNKAGEHIDNIGKDDSIGKNATDIFPLLCDLGLLEILKRVWTTGVPEQHPLTLYRDSHISVWRESYVYKLLSGDVVFVYDDVTEQKQMVERESNLLRELKTIFENFPVGIVYLDNDFRIISTNRFFNTLMGFDGTELRGKFCYDMVGEFSHDESRKGDEKICSFCNKSRHSDSMHPAVIERPYRDKFLRVTTIPERDETGNLVRFMEIIEDVTERKQAEAEAVRASHLAAIGELAAGVAHEINNPINGIINYAQMLLNRSAEGSEAHAINSKIIKESDRIAGIVGNLLSFARDSRDEKTFTSVNDILDDSLALIETQLRRDGIMIVLSLDNNLPPVRMQAQQIEQVFLNIISNARYALNQRHQTANDDKVIEISTALSEDGGQSSQVRVTFHDRGTGIPPELIGKIMNPFFSTKPGLQGTGLGLSISHGIVSDHGGTLRIKSREGLYTEVTIDLPVARN